jgi:putative transposase
VERNCDDRDTGGGDEEEAGAVGRAGSSRGTGPAGREQGLSLTGPDGLPKQLTKVVLGTALDQEMTEHLGHEKNTPSGNEAGSVRNGSRRKTVLFRSSVLV